jgi:parallel beta-helix repeat protein
MRTSTPSQGSIYLSGLLAVASLALLAPDARAAEVSCGQVIATSTTVDNSLSECPGDGLVIGASAITLDLNGQTIDGVGLGVGVRNDGFDDVTVRNGTVREFDYGAVLSPGAHRNLVTGVLLVQHEWAGVYLDDADDNQVRDNWVADFSDVGIRLTNGSSSNVVRGNAVTGGNGEGVVIDAESNLNRLEANEISGSSNAGVRADSSHHNTLVANRVSGSADAAILLSGATGSVVRSNTLTLSGDAAVVLRAASDGNRVVANQIDNSSDAGVFVLDSSSNVVRGNALVANAIGIEASHGELNRVEFNHVTANLGMGIEVAESARSTVLGNTVSGNFAEGIYLDGESVENSVTGNAAYWNDGDGIHVKGPGTVLTGNLATNNLGWGIYVAPGVIDGGGNGANGNAELAQCYLIACSDGSDWQPPVQPPEPGDPPVPPVPAPPAGPGAGLGGTARLTCRPRRAARARARVCKVRFRAGATSRRVTARLVRGGRVFASGSRTVKPGRRSNLAMRARRRIRPGRYTLLLTFVDAGGGSSLVRQAVRVRLRG